MAQVYQFPVKKQLTPEVENCLKEIASAYVKTLHYALSELSSDNPTNEELNEIRELVELGYVMGVYEAINNLEDES